MISNLNEIGFYTMTEDRVKNVSITSQMKRCEMIIIERCNFKCPYCKKLNNKIWSDGKGILSIEDIQRNIDYWCEGMPLENIRFSGGEPTLHPDIREAISYAKYRGIKRIAISTNGSNDLNLYKELIKLGINDFSISLDGYDPETVNKMSGVDNAYNTIINNIRELSKLTYVTVGIVLTEENIEYTFNTILFAESLGVSDIRVISAAQYNKPIEAFNNIGDRLLNKYPLLKYRANNFSKYGLNVRGMLQEDSPYCGLVWDDSVIAGNYHFPCVIYMREGGEPIGRVDANMRQDRKLWADNHNSFKDPICKNNCLDVCRDYCNKFKKYHPKG